MKSKQEALYEAINSSLGSSPEKIARLCWNNNGWISPSGPEGKSNHKDSYEYENGFGHEEWLFDFSKLIDGYHYAFLEPILRNWQLYAGSRFHIHLYAIESTTKKRYWIGLLKNVNIITLEESSRIFKQYQCNGWIDEMQNQLHSVKVTRDLYDFRENLFNVKFRPEDAELLDEPVELSSADLAVSSPRYILLNKRSAPTFKAGMDGGFKFVEKKPIVSESYASSYDRPSAKVEVPYLHRKISEQLYQYLKKMHPKGKVSAEHPSGYGTQIDLVLNLPDGLTFYEIKTYPSIKANIREALGQLLEYCYFPEKNLAKELIIVSPQDATDDIAKYMRHLRSQFRIPLYYQQFDLKENTLKQKV